MVQVSDRDDGRSQSIASILPCHFLVFFVISSINSFSGRGNTLFWSFVLSLMCHTVFAEQVQLAKSAHTLSLFIMQVIFKQKLLPTLNNFQRYHDITI